ncbi:MAG: NFACT family protein [Bacteroidota bacterium]
MITNYHTLHALVTEWRPALVGCALRDAFSQVRDELTLAFQGDDQAWMLRLSVRPPQFVFRTEGYAKARRNVATLFASAFGQTVTDLRLAHRDRILYLDLADGRDLRLLLFGPKANVFLVRDGTIEEAFQGDAVHAGQGPPTPRAAPVVDTLAAFEARWPAQRKTVAQAVARAMPLLDRSLAEEVVHRAGVQATRPDEVTEAERARLFEVAQALTASLAAPSPRIYWRGRFADTFALVPLESAADQREESFETVGEAVRLFVRRQLAEQHLRAVYDPLEKALTQARDRLERQAARMLDELTQASRADRYERWGHLLMAAAHTLEAGLEEAQVPDLFAETQPPPPETIPLDPLLTAVENAERYYDKARQTRAARDHAEVRMEEAEAQAQQATALLEELQGLNRAKEVEVFRKAHRHALAPFLGQRQDEAARFPFRRFPLPDGYELWVAKNARQNDELTLRHARKDDLWLHARGVPGSHAVLRLPNRQATPGKHVLEQAAAIAAYYSKAQGSSLAPVIITPRKYVRKPKGAAPGAVLVEREQVVLVEPKLPG